MKYSNLEEIKKQFNISSDDPKEIKKELKNRIKKIHPDKTDEKTWVEEDREKFIDITEAMNFIDDYSNNNSTSMVPIEEVKSIISKTINELAPIKEQTKMEESISEKQKELSVKIDNNVSKIKNKSLFPKITSMTITSILTLLFMFPKQISNHPILSNFLDVTSFEFVAIWIMSVFITTNLWIITRMKEKKKENYLLKINNISYQNKVFKQFCIHLQNKSFNDAKSKKDIMFNKNDFINYLINSNKDDSNNLAMILKKLLKRSKFSYLLPEIMIVTYSSLITYFFITRRIHIPIIQLVLILISIVSFVTIYTNYHINHLVTPSFFINEEIGHNLANLVFERAEKKDIIKKDNSNNKTIIDNYKFLM